MSLHDIFTSITMELIDGQQKALKEDPRTSEKAGLKSENVEIFWSFADKEDADDAGIAELEGLGPDSTVMDVLIALYDHALLECDADDYETFSITEAYIDPDEDEEEPKATFVIEFKKDEDEVVCVSCDKALKEEDDNSSFYCSCRTCKKYFACDGCSGGWTCKERNYCEDCEPEDDACSCDDHGTDDE